MFVVNTTSATVGTSRPNKAPRKRAPSSRRRNPLRPRNALTYGFFAGGCSAGVFAPVAGAGVVFGAGVVGAGVNGIAGFAPPAAAPGAAPAGALAGGVWNVWSRIDRGARL